MDINRIKQIDGKIDEMHQTLGDSPNAMVNFQAVYNDMKYLIMMALDGQKEANKLRTKIGRMKITIKKKDRVIRTIDHHNNRLGNDNRAKTTVLEKFREENKRLREALEYYADTKHYEPYCIPVGDYATDVTEDNGEIARQALDGGE
ncbi:hypothetical protein FC756_26980 [Lysinibacillus mangiferihumi]|uniref:Uncharacterized protein n=1 Tax=Lysinibacillus mangiferihumi TaxID=1130819 RepID=A0A4U2Y070_9BACI|nr:hypothetical protein [Lysinibacillus mangiferihumi]TKI52852.1 hypothetical protein FC756_26980 [Lysinibacillus mangiferihumi]